MAIRTLLTLGLFTLQVVSAGTAEPAKRQAPTMAAVLAGAQASDWRPLDPENTLYVELAAGRVVIELAPAFAPRHVANVKALAREGYYDGLDVVRAQDNYVVQLADPNSEKPGLARKIQHAQRTLPAEFERSLDPQMPFARLPDGDVYAPEVGFSGGFPMARDPRNGKMWLVHCYALEVMRTETPLFLELIESRRNRREPWFQVPAGRIEIGNVPIPVRLAGAKAR